MIIHLSSRQNDKIKHVIALRNKRTRKEEGLFVSEGRKAMEMAKESGLLVEVYTTKTLKLPNDIMQYIINEDLLNKISLSVNPEGIVFISKMPNIEIKKHDKYLYLENIQDPGNLGTLIRTALALGYDAIFLSDNSCDPFNDKAIAASKGSLFKMPIHHLPLSEFLGNREIIVSTLSHDSIDIDDCYPTKPFILVLGNEAHGVSDETLDIATKKVIIPISGIDSLNVAQAGAIMMYVLNQHFEK